MKFIKNLGTPKWGGKCSKCNNQKTAYTLRKVILQFKDRTGNEANEVFIICTTCLKEIKNQE